MGNLNAWNQGFAAIGALAWAFCLITTIFTLVDTAALSTSTRSTLGLAIIAAILDLITLVTFYVLIMPLLRGKGHCIHLTSRRAHVLFLISVVLAVASCGVTLGLLVWLQLNHGALELPEWWFGNMITKFALWTLATIGQAAVYIVAWTSRRDNRQSLHSSHFVDDRGSASPVTKEMGPPLTLQTVTASYAHVDAPGSPILSRASSKSFESLRTSVHHALRSPTSRSRLIGRPETPQRVGSSMSERSSLDQGMTTDAFDAWDTSSVDRHLKDTVFRGASPIAGTEVFKSTTLPTIPGSRPASPGNGLDRSFGNVSPRRDDNISDLVKPPSIFTRPDSRASARSEAHIHPLFRTDSPTPPPAATPGTIITAAPGGGSVLNVPLRRRASSINSASRPPSRAPSPSPLQHARSFDHGIDRKKEHRRSSSSPPSREMTPPLPSFQGT